MITNIHNLIIKYGNFKVKKYINHNKCPATESQRLKNP